MPSPGENPEVTSFFTFPPAFKLILQFLDHDVQTPVLLLLLLILLLPLLGGQLQVHRHCVLYGFSSETTGRMKKHSDLWRTYFDHSTLLFPLIRRLAVPLSKHEGGLGFSLVVNRRRAADDDGSSTVSTQRVLKDPGHLTVSVWNVGFLETHETRHNHFT